MNDNRYRYAQNSQPANAPSSTMFGYVPPAKGLPYGMIEAFSAPVQTGNNAPSAANIPGRLAPPPALGTTMPARPVAQPPPQQNGILWGQFGKGAGQAALGAAGIGAGLALSDTIGGAIWGVPMMAASASDGWQGATRAWDALHGVPSQGTNYLKNAVGAPTYNALELGLVGSAAMHKTPLLVDTAVTGINRAKSIFGKTVPEWNNSYQVPRTNILLDSNWNRGRILGQGAVKGAQAVTDWNDD